MLRGGAALAAVFLCFACALTHKPKDAGVCGLDVIVRVNSSLTKGAPELKRLDSRLYTPSHTDTQNCPVSTLTCFAAEVRVLRKEWEHFEKRALFKVDRLLQSLAKSLENAGSFPESDCRQCELFQEEDAETFLGELLSALQYVHSRFCI